VRLVSPVESTLGWKVAEGGGESRGEALSGELPSVKVGEEKEEEGVIGRGLSGEGVRGTARSGWTFGFSVRNGPSMTMSVVGKESTRVLTEKVEEEPRRNMGGGIKTTFGEVWERCGGRSGERRGRGGDFEGVSSCSRVDLFEGERSRLSEVAVSTRDERGPVQGSPRPIANAFPALRLAMGTQSLQNETNDLIYDS
jgi:hypothetical protein